MFHHVPTAFGAIKTGLDTFFHAADFLTTLRAGSADFSADLTQTMLKMRSA
jgi:hypothetical protein